MLTTALFVVCVFTTGLLAFEAWQNRCSANWQTLIGYLINIVLVASIWPGAIEHNTVAVPSWILIGVSLFLIGTSSTVRTIIADVRHTLT